MQIGWLNVVNIQKMGSCRVFMIQVFILVCLLVQCFDAKVHADLNAATLVVDASQASGRPIPDTLFGLFFEVRIRIV